MNLKENLPSRPATDAPGFAGAGTTASPRFGFGRAFAWLLLAFALLAPAAQAQVGSTDSFNPAFNAAPFCTAQQPDGKVLFGGQQVMTTLNGGTVSRTSLARVNADGTADTSFNANITAGTVNSIAVQPDGKILVWSISIAAGAYADNFPIARLNVDGSRDSTFNVTVGNQPDLAFIGGVATLALQPDGKAVYGYVSVVNSTYKRIGRLNANGTTDTAFNSNVASTLTAGFVGGIAIQSDGRIVFASTHDLTASGGGYGINRLMPDGTLDTTFAGATLNSTLGSPQGNTFALSAQADGKLVVSGNIVSGTYNGMTRLDVNGSLDRTFAPSFLTSVPASATLNFNLIQADGKVLGVGSFFATVNGTARTFVVRLDNDAATQSLAATSTSTVTWTRTGSAPAPYAVYFEHSANGGSTWTRLTGDATRMSGTGNWQLTGQSLPASGDLRATGLFGYSRNSGGGGSLVQQVASYTLVIATAAVVTTATQSGATASSATLGGNVTADGGSPVTERGVVFSLTSANADPLISGSGVTNVATTGTTGVFTVPVTGLAANSGYSFKAYAINGVGTTCTTPVATFTTGRASTIVTNTLDSGTGSLRQAVLNANANPGADAITFDPTVFATAQTITVSALPPNYTMLALTGDTTVTGPAAVCCSTWEPARP
jgi:uncharacterized delta-60 repeat protein